MAFLQENVKLGRGSNNNSISNDQLAIHTYNTTDSIFEIFESNYFPPYLGFDDNDIKTNDIFYINCPDGKPSYIIQDPADFSFIGTSNDVYQTVPIINARRNVSAIGPFATPQNIQYLFYQTGNFLHITVPAVSQVVQNTATIIINNFLDPSYLPASSFIQEAYVINGPAKQGFIQFDGSANSVFISSYVPTKPSALCGFLAFTLTIQVPGIA